MDILSCFNVPSISNEQETVMNTIVNEKRDVFFCSRTGSRNLLCFQALPDAMEISKKLSLFLTTQHQCSNRLSESQHIHCRYKNMHSVRNMDGTDMGLAQQCGVKSCNSNFVLTIYSMECSSEIDSVTGGRLIKFDKNLQYFSS